MSKHGVFDLVRGARFGRTAVIGPMALILLAGCGTIAHRAGDLPGVYDSPGFPPGKEALERFELGAGDEIDLKLVNHPEFNQRIIIRPDGRFSILFAEEIVAAGKTIAELDDELTAKLGEQLKGPELTLVLHKSKRQVVYVGGEVKKPGMFEIIGGRMTVTEAVLSAGGYARDTANLEEVIVLRRSKDGYRHSCKINLEDLLVSADPLNNLELEPLDVVIVPPKGVVDVNDFIDRYINRNLPGRGLFGVNLTSN